MDLVDNAVRKTMARFPRADEADLRSKAMNALQSAASKFDPTLNNDFAGYAKNLISRRLSRPMDKAQRINAEQGISTATPTAEGSTVGDTLVSSEATPA